MKRRTLVYGDGTRDDLLGIVAYIATDSEINANKVLDRLEAKIASLTVMAGRGRIVPELRWHGITNVHEVFEGPWRILYQITADSVLLVGVFDGRRHLEDVVMERILRHGDSSSSFGE